MKRLPTILVTLLCLSMAAAAPVRAEPQASSGIIYFTTDDPDMNLAIAEARRTVPTFWAWYDAAAPEARSTATLKVAYAATPTGNEYIWTHDIERKDGEIWGVISNVPARVPGLKLHDRVKIDPGRITDWGYVSGGYMWGNFTTRLAVKRSPGQRWAMQLARHLSLTPLEPSPTPVP